MHIASEGGLQRPEYRALVLVNKHFFNTFTHMLYSDLIISFPRPLNFPPIYDSASTFAMGGPQLEMLLDRLQSNQALRNYVRTCRIEYLQYSPAQLYRDKIAGHAGMYDTFGDAVIMSLLGTLPRLLHVTFSSTEIYCRWLLHLATRPSLISITIESSSISGEGTLQEPVTITSFTSSIWDYKGPFEIPLSRTLQHLYLPSTSMTTIAQGHQEQGKPLLPNLKTLHIQNLVESGFDVLKCMPNLEDFRIVLPSFISESLSRDWTSILPRLAKFEGPCSLIPHFVTRRSVVSLYTTGAGLAGPVLANLQFGSKVPVRFVNWACCHNILGLIKYLVESNPLVEVFRISLKTGRAINRVCFSPSYLFPVRP
jgi:hypothetical protein